MFHFFSVLPISLCFFLYLCLFLHSNRTHVTNCRSHELYIPFVRTNEEMLKFQRRCFYRIKSKTKTYKCNKASLSNGQHLFQFLNNSQNLNDLKKKSSIRYSISNEILNIPISLEHLRLYFFKHIKSNFSQGRTFEIKIPSSKIYGNQLKIIFHAKHTKMPTLCEMFTGKWNKFSSFHINSKNSIRSLSEARNKGWGSGSKKKHALVIQACSTYPADKIDANYKFWKWKIVNSYCVQNRLDDWKEL